jgi:hypothetical protein
MRFTNCVRGEDELLHNLSHNLADQRRSQQLTAAHRSPKQLKTLKRRPFCMVWPITQRGLSQARPCYGQNCGQVNALGHPLVTPLIDSPPRNSSGFAS